MHVDLTAIHWLYVAFIGLIILFLILGRDTSLPRRNFPSWFSSN